MRGRFAPDDRGAFALPFLVGLYLALSAQLLLLFVLIAGGLYAVLGLARAEIALRRLLPFALALALFFAWAAASALWSLDARTTLAWVGTDAAVALAGMALLAAAFGASERQRRWSRLGALAGWAVAWLALTAQLVANTPFLIFGGAMPADPGHWRLALNNQSVALALLAWPAGQALAERGRWRGLVPPLLTLATLAHGSSAAALLALGIGIVAFALAAWRPRLVLAALGLALALSFAALPGLVRAVDGGALARAVPAAVEFSAFHRFEIWRFAAEKIAERPWLGWGARVASRIPGAGAGIALDSPRAAKLRQAYSGHAPVMPKHPHNIALQARLDLGLVGAALAFAALAAVLLALPRAGPAAPTALALAATAFVVAMLSYDLWQDWWHAALWLAAAFTAAGAARPSWTADPAAV